jgi:hypothetical protein
MIGNQNLKKKKKKLYLITDFGELPIHTSSIRNNALHDLTLIKMIVIHFVGTGRFLIAYCNGHTQ